MKKFPMLPRQAYDDIRQSVRSGDVLLASGEYMFSKLIQRATNSCWSHVAFIMRLDIIDRVMVLESIEGKGVRTVPLSEYVKNFEGTGEGYKGRLAIARHADFESRATEQSLKAMAQFAVDRFARPYDEEEIARITARIVGSALGFKKGEIKRNEEYICSEYVYECYSQLGLNITYDERGFVAPADFSRDKRMQLLWEVSSIRSDA
jgi:hypothetical protein